MKVSYEHDGDQRYGWASVDIEDAKTVLIVVHGDGASRGFTYSDGGMTPACICQAYEDSECGCPVGK